MNTKKFHLAGETALLLVLLINSLAVDLMSKSGFGISTISSVPLIFSTAFPFLTFPDIACHHTDDPETFLLPWLPFFLRSRNRFR